MAEKILYKTQITIEVVSPQPYRFGGFESLERDLDIGECTARVCAPIESVTIKGPVAVQTVKEHNVDPEFFGMNEYGDDIDDCEDTTSAKLVSTLDDGRSVTRSCEFDLHTRTVRNVEQAREADDEIRDGSCISRHILLDDETTLFDFITEEGFVFVSGKPRVT